MPANRPATDRIQSLRPLFSWMTSTPPRGFGASAHAACSSPRGPAQVIGAVGTVFSDPGGGALAVAGSLEVTGASEVGFLFSLHAAISVGRGRGADAEQCQPAQGLASGQQAVNVIGGDFFGDIAL